MIADMRSRVAEWVRVAGYQMRAMTALPPGFTVHEVGTARMGVSPDTSVLDPWNRIWDFPNVYVTDGACFPSSGFQNPTLTMLAITSRACSHLIDSDRDAAGARR
jgi:choline dehydrogenase-like flavoprotein